MAAPSVTATATAPPQPPPPPPVAAAATGARPSTASGGDAPVPPAPQMDHAALLLVAGARLRYSQETTARAVAFFYELRRAFERDETELLAATCLFLAGKSAETPRRVRDVVNAVHRARRSDAATLPLDDAYFRRKAAVVDAEQKALRLLGFDLETPTCHRLALTFAHAARCSTRAARIAAALANDALLDETCRGLPAAAVAAAAVDVALAADGQAAPSRCAARFGVADRDVGAARTALVAGLERALAEPPAR